MPGRSKKGGGLEVGSAYKMKYNKSSFPFKTDTTKDIDEAKKLVRDNVGNTTVDAPPIFDPKHFDKAEKNIIKANEILKKAGYSFEEREQMTGAGGYQAAMDWAKTKK